MGVLDGVMSSDSPGLFSLTGLVLALGAQCPGGTIAYCCLEPGRFLPVLASWPLQAIGLVVDRWWRASLARRMASITSAGHASFSLDGWPDPGDYPFAWHANPIGRSSCLAIPFNACCLSCRPALGTFAPMVASVLALDSDLCWFMVMGHPVDERGSMERAAGLAFLVSAGHFAHRSVLASLVCVSSSANLAGG